MTLWANSRQSDYIAAHYKIVPIKIADKLPIKIIYDENGVYVLFCSLYEHTTRKIKSIYAIFLSHIIIFIKLIDPWVHLSPETPLNNKAIDRYLLCLYDTANVITSREFNATPLICSFFVL